MSEKKTVDKRLLIWKITSIAITVLFVPIIILNSFILVSTLASKDKVPTVFGYGMLVILSDSMEGEFKTDDAIFIKKVEDINMLQVGDIICYRDENAFVTHRIDSITEENGQKAFKTKGDANNAVDMGNVTNDEIQGVYIGKATGLFNFINFMQSPLGVMLVFIIPCLIYARYEVYLWQKKKEEELAEVQAALKASNSELEETKNKLAELLERGAVTAAAVTENADNADNTNAENNDETAVAEELAAVAGNTDDADAEDNADSTESTEDANSEGVFVLSGSLSEIKLRRSFMSRYIQAHESIQRYYNTVKNLLLSYGKIKTRTSWKSESFKSGRTHVAKIDIKGKKLYLYLALNPGDFADSKYFFTDLSAKDSNLPMLVKIKSNRAEKHAIELIEILAEKLGLAKVNRDSENYSMPYETDEALIAKGLIKVVAGEIPITTPALEAPIKELGTADLPYTAEKGDSDSTEEFVLAGSLSEIRLRRSFTARYIQADESLQTYYTNIKNLLLSFKKVKARTSWRCESFKSGRTHVAKIDIKGKKLYLCLALDPAEFADSKYFITDLSAKNTSLPLLIKIKSNRAEKHAIELIEILAEKLGLVKTGIESEDYRLPYEADDQLIAKGLIKIIGAPPQADAPEINEVAEAVDINNDGENADAPGTTEAEDGSAYAENSEETEFMAVK